MAIKYARLFSPTTQFQTRSGALNTAGLLRVFINNTDDLAQVYNDNMELMRQPIVLDDNGRAQGVFCDIKKVYRLEVYDRNDSLLFTIPNLQATEAAGGSTIITPGSMQHWLGMYGPTYTPFPGDNAGHTLGIPRNEIEYVGNFIDHFDTCPYPDSTPVGYIYLKPGLYFVSCIIRYQQDPEVLSNTLDEVLVYTGHGNANESLAYQMDSSGPETTGNRHNVRVQFIRKVPEDAETEILYFAPGTPIAWKEAYIQRLEIVKLDGIKGEPGEQGPKGDTGPQGPQGEIPFTVPFEAGDGIIMELDSDGEELKVIISVDSDSVPAGETGATGADGKSAYQIWLEQGNTGTEQDFLDSLVGATGAQGIQGIQGIQGQTGADGKSAYEIWLENGHTGSEQDFLNSLVGATGATGADGADGATGADGKSAYEIWLENGHTGTESDFLASLVGATGATGMTGPEGPQGATGPKGDTGEWGGTVDQTYDATSENPQSGTAVAEAVATKEDEFDAGDGLEFITDSDGNRVLQVEGPVDVVAGPGIVIDNPDGNTLRISQATPSDETVLWTGTETLNDNSVIHCSERLDNFSRIDLYAAGYGTQRNAQVVSFIPQISESGSGTDNTFSVIFTNYPGGASLGMRFNVFLFSNDGGTDISLSKSHQFSIVGTNVSTGTPNTTLYRVVGIHRIANN